MALNPRITTETLFPEIQTYFQFYTLPGEISAQIFWKAVEKETTIDNLIPWVFLMRGILLRSAVTEEEVKRKLLGKLRFADSRYKENESQGKLLVIDAQTNIYQDTVEYLIWAGKNSVPNISKDYIEWVTYPPQNIETWKLIFKNYSKFFLHNLSSEDLSCIHTILSQSPNLIKNTVIVKTGDTITDQLEKQYKALEQLGVVLLRRPYSLRDVAVALFK